MCDLVPALISLLFFCKRGGNVAGILYIQYFTSSTYHQPVTLPGCSKVRTSVSVANLCLSTASSLSSPTAMVTFTHLAKNQTRSINTDCLEEPDTKIIKGRFLFDHFEIIHQLCMKNIDDATNNIHNL